MLEPDESHYKQLLAVTLKRSVTKLFKSYLSLLLELQQRHLEVVKCLQDSGASEDIIQKINYLNLKDYGIYRKRVLDNGNDTIRDIEKILEEFELIGRLRKSDEQAKEK